MGNLTGVDSLIKGVVDKVIYYLQMFTTTFRERVN